MAVSRITLEFFRVVRIVPLRLDAVVLREGERIQLVEVRVTGPDGEELSRALVQRLRLADVGTPGDQSTTRPGFPGPEEIPAAARWVFMNPDLTVHVNALPDGEWVALAAESHYHPSGRGDRNRPALGS